MTLPLPLEAANSSYLSGSDRLRADSRAAMAARCTCVGLVLFATFSTFSPTQGIAQPILIGNRKKVQDKIAELGIELNVTIIDPEDSELTEPYAQELYRLRQRKGVTLSEARRIVLL